MKKIPDDLKSLEERINKQRAVEKAARKDRPESEFAYATKTGFRVGTELVSGRDGGWTTTERYFRRMR